MGGGQVLNMAHYHAYFGFNGALLHNLLRIRGHDLSGPPVHTSLILS